MWRHLAKSNKKFIGLWICGRSICMVTSSRHVKHLSSSVIQSYRPC